MLNDFRSEWFWWNWQGPTPDKSTVDWVNRNYAPGWTYADFARDVSYMFNQFNKKKTLSQASLLPRDQIHLIESDMGISNLFLVFAERFANAEYLT